MKLHYGLWLTGFLAIAVAHAQENESNVLPRYLTEQERAEMEATTPGSGAYLWECPGDGDPFLFPFGWAYLTDPPTFNVRFPTESELTRGVVYGWPSYGCQMPELTELIRNSIRNAETTVFVPTSLLGSAQSCLRGRGFTDDDINQVRWYPIRALDGIWIRDYGMEIIDDFDDGHPVFIDMGYYSGRASSCAGPFPGRPNDDVSPTIFAPDFNPLTDVYRPALRTEGGNLQTDGLGTCVHMQRDVLAENRFDRWFYTQEQLDQIYTDYFQCTRVITLQSFQLDPQVGLGQRQVIDHVDMFMTFISQKTVIVAQADPADAAFDPFNAQVMENNAQTLANAGYNVVRIPQTRRFCTVHRASCISNVGDARTCDAGGSLDRVWATFANSIRVGNRMMVPVYHDVPVELADAIATQEQQALQIFQDTLDAEFGVGQVIVTPIVSDRMIPCQGSVHCISMTYK